MSGGALDYIHSRISWVLDDLSDALSDKPDAEISENAGDIRERLVGCQDDPAEAAGAAAVEAAIPRLRRAERALRAIEWWLSGDTDAGPVVDAVAKLEAP